MLRCLSLGLAPADLDDFTPGSLLDLLAVRDNIDYWRETRTERTTQAEFDSF